MDKNQILVIIPARYASTRFPGKPLAQLGGRSVIERVYRRVAAVMPNVAVATDDERIARTVEAFGGVAVMTSANHRSGTDRCREAYLNLGSTAQVVINVQGDEPFVDRSQLEALAACFDNPDTDIATLIRRFDPARGFDALFDPNLVKVVTGAGGRALYFSRSIIPYTRGAEWQKWLETTAYYTHVGVYAYRAHVLDSITRLEPSSLEIAESLEQLRWLQNNYVITTAITDAVSIGIDTPADLQAAEDFLQQHPEYND